MQNHAESSRNFVKNSALDPKQAKLKQQSEIWTHMGPARALEESVGPARALEEREKSGKAHSFFNTFLQKDYALGLQTAFFEGFNVLLSFLVET